MSEPVFTWNKWFSSIDHGVTGTESQRERRYVRCLTYPEHLDQLLVPTAAETIIPWKPQKSVAKTSTGIYLDTLLILLVHSIMQRMESLDNSTIGTGAACLKCCQ